MRKEAVDKRAGGDKGAEEKILPYLPYPPHFPTQNLATG